jgi:L-seryl-tRNA(Ser) seleniumtransferase
MTASRRDLFRAGALAAASPLAAAPSAAPNIYTRIGVRPFINLTATYTINGGTLTLPEVKEAMDAASRYSVNLDELMEHAGERLSQLLGVESGMVTSGAAAAMVHATTASITGGDPEKMVRVPNLAGLKNEVIMPKASRNVYDHAIRSTGVRIVEIETREQFLAALGRQTAMIAVLGTGEARSKVRLEELAAEGRKAGVPVYVDAAAELPSKPNAYLSRGADLVGYSGGKTLSGPQCAGLLLGRKDLIRAAWVNSSPHHAFGRSMKVGKEEIMGMLAAIDVWMNKRDIQADYRKWEGWLAYIGSRVTQVDGVKIAMRPPAGASPFPVMDVEWDPEKTALTAGELHKLLLDGEPRIMSHADGPGHGFLVRPAAMQAGDEKLVAERLFSLLKNAPKKAAKAAPREPAADLSGKWNVEMKFAAGNASHSFEIQMNGNRVSGTHSARALQGALSGMADGANVRFSSGMPFEGTRLSYTFTGSISGGRMSGECALGEYGAALWTAVKA